VPNLSQAKIGCGDKVLHRNASKTAICMNLSFTYTIRFNEIVEASAEDAVSKVIEMLQKCYVLVEGSIECLTTYSQLLEFAGIVIKDRDTVVMFAKKNQNLKKLLNVSDRDFAKTLIIELKHSLPAILQQVEPSMCTVARYGSWEVPEKLVLMSVEKRLRKLLKLQ